MTRLIRSCGASSRSTATCIAARSLSSMSVIGAYLLCGFPLARLARAGRLTQPGESPRRVTLDRAEAASEHPCGLRLGKVIEVTEHQHRTLARRQRRERPEQVIPLRNLGVWSGTPGPASPPGSACSGRRVSLRHRSAEALARVRRASPSA